MVSISGAFLFLGGVLSAMIGSLIGYKLVHYIASRGRYTTENAVELLKLKRSEDWNTLRQINPQWQPNLISVNLTGVSLVDTNLSLSVMTDVDFTNSQLESVDFSGSSLTNVKFNRAELNRVSFDRSVLSKVSFDDAKINEVAFEDVKTEATELPHQNPLVEWLEDFDLLRKVHDEPDRLNSLSPKEFERFAALLFEKLNYRVEDTSRSLEAGVDLIAFKSDPIVGETKTLIECKSFGPKHIVGVSPVESLNFLVRQSNASKGILITNSRFSDLATEFVKNHPYIELVDRTKIRELLSTLY